MKFIVDRIEGDIVVCENEIGDMVDVSISEFKEIPVDGDIVFINSSNIYEIDKEETRKKKMGIQERFKKLFKR